MVLISAGDESMEPRGIEMRARNERIAAAARRHHFDQVAPVPFLCECNDDECEALVRITLAEYESSRLSADFLVVPGH